MTTRQIGPELCSDVTRAAVGGSAALRPRLARVAVGTGCTGCGGCLLTCPEHALRPTPAGLVVRADRCTGCGECIEICPADAIEELAWT